MAENLPVTPASPNDRTWPWAASRDRQDSANSIEKVISNRRRGINAICLDSASGMMASNGLKFFSELKDGSGFHQLGQFMDDDVIDQAHRQLPQAPMEVNLSVPVGPFLFGGEMVTLSRVPPGT